MIGASKQVGNYLFHSNGRITDKDNQLVTSLTFDKVISKEKAKAAAKAIENNTTLTSIDLSYNDIGDEGAKAIDVALVSNIFILLEGSWVESEAVLDQTQERNYAVRDTKRQANGIQTTKDIQTLQTYHDQLPNGLSCHYLATLIHYHHCLPANREEKN